MMTTPLTGPQVAGIQAPGLKTERRLKHTMLVMTLNEIDGMKAVMPRVRPEWLDQIIVVDGGSKDGTIEWAKEQGYEVHELLLLRFLFERCHHR